MNATYEFDASFIVLNDSFLPLHAMFTDLGYVNFDLTNNYEFVVHILNKDFYALFQPKIDVTSFESTAHPLGGART